MEMRIWESLMLKLKKAFYWLFSLESKDYRVYVIADQKVVDSLNVTFDDTKLPSLQRDEDSESLEFEDLSEDLSDNEEVPDAATGSCTNWLINDDDNNDFGNTQVVTVVVIHNHATTESS